MAHLLWKRMSQRDHDAMVRTVATWLTGNGYRDVRADLPEWPRKPEKITWKHSGEGHVPDATAWGEKFHLFEVETADSISGKHTEDQWKLFAAFAAEHDAVFFVVVPRGYAHAARAQLIALGISAQVWEL